MACPLSLFGLWDFYLPKAQRPKETAAVIINLNPLFSYDNTGVLQILALEVCLPFVVTETCPVDGYFCFCYYYCYYYFVNITQFVCQRCLPSLILDRKPHSHPLFRGPPRPPVPFPVYTAHSGLVILGHWRY